MICEHAADGGVGSKKRSLTSPGVMATAERSIMSPPTKKLKQARLPFKVISSPSRNQCSKAPADPLPSKKRKLSASEQSPLTSQPKAKIGDGKSSTKKTAEKRLLASPVTPKTSRIETIDLEEPEVTSSCEDQDAGKAASSFSVTPKKPSSSSKPKCLESFLQTTQQPQVSTSDAVIDLCGDDSIDVESSNIKEPLDADIPDPVPSAGGTADGESIPQQDYQSSIQCEKEVTTPSDETCESEATKEDRQSDLDVSMSSCPDEADAVPKLTYDADSEDANDDDEEDSPRIRRSSEGSSEAGSFTSGTATTSPVTPSSLRKPLKKTPLSAKALNKLQEKDQQRDSKIKLRMEKKRKLEEEEAERKRRKLELRQRREEERDQVRRQKEAEKDEKKKEKQQKRDLDEKEKEEKKMAKEEERKKKQELIDAKMEEKRKKNEERQRQEDEKRQQEDEKREKQAKQKNLFKSFFKEAVVPVKKRQEQSCTRFAPFQVQENMVLAPLRRSNKLLDLSDEFEAAFQNQNCASLYLDELKGKSYPVGKMGRTQQAETGQKECNSRTPTPSVETIQQDKDSEDVEIVPDVAPKKLARMKCKLLQFHENYRPAYYGTWRQRSKAINPRNYLKKDEDLLDYDVDSEDEWEEPGESLSHSEGEDDGEDVDEGGDSDDGFFVPHGYLSESEGCEDEEDDNWKERRAAKAKSWEVELKRQQGILKPVLVGCFWATCSSKMAASKMLEAYKVVTLTTVPIDLRSRKQIMASSETQSLEVSSSKLPTQIKGTGMEGVSQKRPVPAEAMPDLIRLVHGNVAGIRTLQREFREYWRLKEISKKSRLSTPRPDTPSATLTGAESSQEKSPAEVSPLRSGPGADDVPAPVKTELMGVPACSSPQSLAKDAFLGGDVGTQEPSRPGQTLPGISTGDNIECSISKRQLMLTISAIAVRERRAAFPRTCWYVHQNLLEKHGLLNLPIPSQWQNITKPLKAVRAESPLVGISQSSASGMKQQTPGNYAVSASGGLPMGVNQMQHVGAVHHSLNPAFYAASNSLVHVLQVPGPRYQTHERLQGNTVAQSLAMARSCVPNTLPAASIQQVIQQADGASPPVHLQLANGMSACEIMQRLSATLPVQHQGTPAALPSSLQGHIFSPVTSNDQMHYLNMLPKPGCNPYPSSIGGRPSASQIPRADLGQAVKIPRTSPNDIKTLLSSQAAKAFRASPETVAVRPEPNPSAVTQAVPESNSHAEKPPSITPNSQESQSPASTQQPGKKPTTLKSFFNVSVKKPSKAGKTEISKTCGDSNQTSIGASETQEVSISNDPVAISESGKETRTLSIDDGKAANEKGKCQDEKMEVELCQEGNEII